MTIFQEGELQLSSVGMCSVSLYCVAIVADGPMRVRVGTIKDL